ncbi:hypothetical protein [uncultured Tateyamaria sp.]|uniref:hypothetical protein n=1 Tax=uncultured Tateyamaria sp. TaxID=455651 RepID=UPI0026203117|nr:hypothetical protein [uncultured Tateyamaria sp.]
MIALSFLANCLIAFPLVMPMLRRSDAMDAAFGPPSDARRILACIYGTIGLISLFSLFCIAAGYGDFARQIAQTLLPLQIIYKCFTIPAVGLQSVVVKTNIGVSLLHLLTLVSVTL